MLLFCALAVTQRKNGGYKTSVIAAVNRVEERERDEKCVQQKIMEDSRVEFSAKNTLENTRHHTRFLKIDFFKGGAEAAAR